MSCVSRTKSGWVFNHLSESINKCFPILTEVNKKMKRNWNIIYFKNCIIFHNTINKLDRVLCTLDPITMFRLPTLMWRYLFDYFICSADILLKVKWADAQRCSSNANMFFHLAFILSKQLKGLGRAKRSKSCIADIFPCLEVWSLFRMVDVLLSFVMESRMIWSHRG